MIYLDLMLDTGEIVRIECPRRYEVDLHESIENALKRRDWWSPAQFDGCSATLMGVPLQRVWMGRVVGTLE